MIDNDWYRGDNWDKETQVYFETKLRKTRGAYNKSQYLIIKATYLLKTHDVIKNNDGCILLHRVIKEYSTEFNNVMYAHEIMGDYYFAVKDYKLAEANYRSSIDFYQLHGRSGTSGICDVKLAELIILKNDFSKYEEVYKLLNEQFGKTGGLLVLNEDAYRYYSALAKVSFKINKKKEAMEFASNALNVLKDNTYQFLDNKKLEKTNTTRSEMHELEKILQSNVS